MLLSLGLRDNHSFSLSPLPRPQTPPYQYLHVAECSEDSAKWPEEVIGVQLILLIKTTLLSIIITMSQLAYAEPLLCSGTKTHI